nr:hypothetical protein CFP56_55290 [Quercus suber]
MGQVNITLPTFLVILVASSALSDYPPKNPDMILGDKLDSLPYSRLGEASSPWLLHVQSDLPEPTLSMLVGGKGDEDAGLGFLEQPLLPSTAIEANSGAAGSGGDGESNLGSKKVLRSLVMIMLILLMIVGELGVLPTRKETGAVDSWATMSFHHLSFKEYDILQCLEGSPEQQPKVVVLGRVDKGNGRGSGTGQDGTKRFVAAQTSASVIVFHFTGKSCSNKVFLVCVVVGNLVGYLCSITAVLLTRRKPRIAGVFGLIGSTAAATGFLLMIAMFLPSYLVWIVGIASVALLFVVSLAFKS